MRMDRRAWLRWMLGVLASCIFVRPLAAQSARGEVVRIRGRASKSGPAGESVLAPGEPLFVGDTIATGDDGRVDVRFGDGSMLTVGPSSRIQIARYAPDAPAGRVEALLSLLDGILRMVVGSGQRWDRFAVETTTSVASVRGTEWLVEATEGRSAVFVLRGQVEVASRATVDGSVTLLAGEGCDVSAGSAPTAPKRWGPKRRFEALARVSW